MSYRTRTELAPELIGAPGYARRTSPLQVPNTATIGSGTTGARNLAIGRRGQRMVLDRLVFQGSTINGVATDGPTVIRATDQGGGALADRYVQDLIFSLMNTTAGVADLEVDIDRVGFVGDVAIDATVGELPVSLGVASGAGTGSQTGHTIEAWARVRYVEALQAAQAGNLRRGAWGSGFLSSVGGGGTTQTLLAAPGVGFFYRIHTLIVCIPASGNTTSPVTIGSNATPTNAPIMQWRCGPAADRFGHILVLTDVDLPVPENAVVAASAGADFLASVIVGAEIAPIFKSNRLVNLTLAPA